jgi:hypothetical protein
LRALLRRLERLGARGAVAGESRVLAAYGIGTTASIAAVQPLLDSLPDYSLFYLHSMLAGMMADPSAAAPLAGRLTVTSRPRTVQAQGHIALAHMAVTRGRFTEAWRELDLAAPLDPVAAAWSRAYFATLPFAAVGAERRRDAQRALDNLEGLTTGSLPLSLDLGVDVPAALLLTVYLKAQLALADGRVPPPLRCDSRALPRVRALCPDLQLGLETEAGRRAGRTAPGCGVRKDREGTTAAVGLRRERRTGRDGISCFVFTGVSPGPSRHTHLRRRRMAGYIPDGECGMPPRHRSLMHTKPSNPAALLPIS